MRMLFLTLIAALALVQDGAVKWDKTIHDFGDVAATDGPLTCTYTVTNTGSEPIAIFEVVSSCGCTNVQWTKEPIQPGKTGTVSATYKNEDGPMPFDKTLTVYISGIKRPVILRLRGVVHEKKKSLSELYGTQKIGALGIKSRQMKTGNLKQGQQVSEQITVANLGKKALQISWANVSPELSLKVEPNPIPAGNTATLTLTVSANPEKYGRQLYTATPVLNGQKADGTLEITTWTQENFLIMDQATRDNGPIPYFTSSTVNLGTAGKGQKLTVEFALTNRGKSALHFFQADAETPALTLAAPLKDVAPAGKGNLRFTLDTSSLEKGENVIMVSLTTNSPLRPLVNLFVAVTLR